MNRSDQRSDEQSELSARVAAGCVLLLGALAVALAGAARNAPRAHEVGAALAHGPTTVPGATMRLTTLWEVGGGYLRTAATCDLDDDGDEELLLLDDGDMITIFDAQGRYVRALQLRHGARYLEVARGCRPPALIVADPYAPVGAYDGEGGLLWSYPLPITQELTACTLADLDDDGVEEIITAQLDMGLACLDAYGRANWELPLPGLIASLAAGDVDGDGRQEILACGHDTPVFVVSSAGHELRRWDIWASACHVAAADLDGNGTAEVAVKTAAFDRPEEAFVAGVDSAGQLAWRQPVPDLVRSVARPLTAVDINGDGRREWAAVGSDASLHFIGGNGELLGVHTVEEPLIGVYPMRTKAAVGERLVAVSATSATCLEWTRGGDRG